MSKTRSYPSAEEAAADICRVGRLLYDRGYVAANDGNISVRLGPDEVLITPSGVSKGRMDPGMLVRCDLAGKVLPGDRSHRFPSSEVRMHLKVYQDRPDVGAVVHAHPIFATAFSICHRPLSEAYLTETIVNFGEVPVADFALQSTYAVPQSLEPYVHDHDAVLLANHGAITWGADLWQAFDRMESVEHTAKVYKVVSDLGGGQELGDDVVAQLEGLRSFYRHNFGKRD